VLSEGNLMKLMLQLQYSPQKSVAALRRGQELADCQHEMPQDS
jgi:hypothetical protein